MIENLERLQSNFYLSFPWAPKAMKRARYQQDQDAYIWGRPLAQAATANLLWKVPALRFVLLVSGIGLTLGGAILWNPVALVIVPVVMVTFGVLLQMVVLYLANTRGRCTRVTVVYDDGKVRPHHLLGFPAQRMADLFAAVNEDPVEVMEATEHTWLAPLDFSYTVDRFDIEVVRRFTLLLDKEPEQVRETFSALAPDYSGTTGELLAAIRLL